MRNAGILALGFGSIGEIKLERRAENEGRSAVSARALCGADDEDDSDDGATWELNNDVEEEGTKEALEDTGME